MQNKVSSGTVHKIPADVRKMLLSSPKAHTVWEDITPLARNEWICWMTDGKEVETRDRRIQVGRSKLLQGDRRPCCWPDVRIGEIQ